MINLQEKQKEIREFLEWYQKSNYRPLLQRLTMDCLKDAVEAKTEDEYLAEINKMDWDEIMTLEGYYELPLTYDQNDKGGLRKKNLQEKQKEIREFLEWYQKSSHRPLEVLTVYPLRGLRGLTVYCLKKAVEAKNEDEYLAIINQMDWDEIATLEGYYKLPLRYDQNDKGGLRKRNLQEKQKEIREFLEWYQKSSHRLLHPRLRELTVYCLKKAVEAKTEAEYLTIINKMDRDEGPFLEVFFGLSLEVNEE